MHISELANKTLEQQIEEINKTLKELQHNQTEEITLLKKNHAVNMKKLDKIQEYNKISDMTNQLFEQRLLVIENTIMKLSNSLTTKNKI